MFKIEVKVISIAACFAICFAQACICSTRALAQEAIDFSRDIQPILSDYCYACHGPDAATRESGFRLDDQTSSFGEADSGEHPIVPGNVDASEILRRLKSDDETEVMPPEEHKKRPAVEQIELLERWIAEGANWKEHWAFIAPQRPELPEVMDKEWIRNGIDHFVLAKLESQSLTPTKQADDTTLVRRLYLDLTGLPPTLKDVDEFLADQSPDAYEQLVDRLLASSAYGEHMATFWLDAARFADTNGYQNDFRRSMWLWRDWVITAYNANMPFDQFALEQLAGDMLPDATLQQKIASGFNRNHRSNTEGGSINEEWQVENVVDRVETTSTVFLGLTMGCARCHDHKFDPISQREFYQFFSYFNNVDEKGVYTEQRGNAGPTVSVPTKEHKAKLSEAAKEVDVLRGEWEVWQRVLESQQPDWEASISEVTAPDVTGHKLAFLDRKFDAVPDDVDFAQAKVIELDEYRLSAIGPTLEISGEEGSHIDLGNTFDFDASVGFTVSVLVRPTKYGAIISRMDEANAYRGFDMLLMPDGRLNVHLIHNWPGNATKVTTVLPIPKDRWSHVVVTCHSPGKAADIQIFVNDHLVQHSADSDTLDGSTLTDHPLWIGLRSKTPAFAGRVSNLRIWNKPLPGDTVAQLFKQSLQYAVVSTKENRTEEQQEVIDSLYQDFKSSVWRHTFLRKELELDELKKQLPTTMVMKELDEPRQTYVLNRGLYDQPDKEQPVSAAVPSLFKSNKKPTNRLELARWIVDGNNPLTSRVAVNHFWSRYFGIGLLDTPENFGVQSPPPSHPELLDWLAMEFVRTEWDMKAIQKLIVTSATYRQSSAALPASFAADPKNRLLARGPRFRMPAESIRDNALKISGLLTEQIGGPSIKPYQPAGLWEELAGGAGEPPYEQAMDKDLYRRSLYIYRKRTVPHPTMTTFDGVGRDVCAVARDRTNTPLQALALLNDTTYVEAAIHLAARAMKSSSEPQERLSVAFRSATSRQPTEQELAILISALKKYQTAFSDDPKAAELFIQSGQTMPSDEFTPVNLAPYASVCSVILNLDEVITKE